MNRSTMKCAARWLAGWLACCAMVQGIFDTKRFPGPYCATRDVGEKCCNGRRDDCSLPIDGGRTRCYCDIFCQMRKQPSKIDCCPDFPKFKYECRRPRVCQPGERQRQGCNHCVCAASSSGSWKWSCTDHTCINDPLLISEINSHHHVYGWTAKDHSMFDDIKLKDGFHYFLGTLRPKRQVFRQHPVHKLAPKQLPPYFDARSKWPGYIQPPLDQGQCASSWAFSAAGVASDRWAIQSKGLYLEQISVQQMIACNTFIRSSEACRSGRMEDAWWWLMNHGAVGESCYPYACYKGAHNVDCYSCHAPLCWDVNEFRQKTTPVYRVSAGEEAIMAEIMRNGPVQALMKVRPDFFLYKRGVYRYTGQGQIMEDYHSVRIIGWGEEQHMKYWLAVNSWGETWGDKGLFKIARGTNEGSIEEFVLAAEARVTADQLIYAET